MKRSPHHIALALLSALTTVQAATLDNERVAELRLLQEVPGVAGELVYRGSVVPLSEPGIAPLFSYERRIADAGAGLAAASHITRDASGQVLINESARVDATYALKRLDAVNLQQGWHGSAELSADGRELHYRVHRDGRWHLGTERAGGRLVAGPSLHGLILQHWGHLAAGGELPLRMVVLKEMKTYGFDVRLAARSAGRTSFSITPSSWLVRLAVKPLSVTFDDASHQVVRYEGRVPPMQQRGGKLEALDARVEYESVAARYR